MRDTRKKIKIGVYGTNVTFIFTDDVARSYDKLCKEVSYLEKWEDAGKNSDGLFVFNEDRVGNYWVILCREAGIGALSHEIVHLTHQILCDRDVKFDIYNDEPFAYLNGYLMEECYPTFLKQKEKSLN